MTLTKKCQVLISITSYRGLPGIETHRSGGLA